MLDCLVRNKRLITIFTFLLSILIILIDCSSISHVYGNGFQWVVSYVACWVLWTINFCIVDKESKLKKLEAEINKNKEEIWVLEDGDAFIVDKENQDKKPK